MINIDLNNLTPEIMARVKPNLGKCKYTAPCIIGALMTPDERKELEDLQLNGTGIGSLVGPEVYSEDFCPDRVSIPQDQFDDAKLLQKAFDAYNWVVVERIASKYIDR
jgi:hypothetical protein